MNKYTKTKISNMIPHTLSPLWMYLRAESQVESMLVEGVGGWGVILSSGVVVMRRLTGPIVINISRRIEGRGTHHSP